MVPRHKRLKRAGRLQAAKHWIPKYDGKKLVKGYAKHFGVDLLCAVHELQLLGHEISPEYIQQLKQTMLGRQKLAEKKKRMKEEQEFQAKYSDSDDTFYYIAGYTSGGAPYGVTWEEMGMEPYGEEKNDMNTGIHPKLYPKWDESDDDELPF
jgi:hypothetical protein